METPASAPASVSVLPLLILVLITGLVVYGIYRYAKRRSLVAQAGVRGWLLLLVIQFMFIWPIFGYATLSNNFETAESQYPNLKTMAKWDALKSATRLTFIVTACLSFYAGIGLAKGRDTSVVKRAKIMLWVIFPASYVVSDLVIPLLVLGTMGSAPDFIRTLLASAAVAGTLTAYLSKSKRVRATYGSPPQNAGV